MDATRLHEAAFGLPAPARLPRVPARGRSCPQRPIRRGQTLYRQGDEALHLYEVHSGLLRLSRVLANGARQVIGFALPGDIVGFPRGTVHTTDCDVLVAGQVTSLSALALSCSARDPELHRRLVRAAVQEIGTLQDHIMILARNSARERVASFLLAMARRVRPAGRPAARIALPMRRSDIADHLGLTVETVCRTLTRMRKAGIIALDGAYVVVILDRAGLEEAAMAD